MTQRSSVARVAAVGALVVALVVAIVVVGGAAGGGDDSGDAGRRGHGQASGKAQPRHEAPATYTIESGDTLTSIAHETGVSVNRIQRLNPRIDPQILIAGEKLKLR